MAEGTNNGYTFDMPSPGDKIKRSETVSAKVTPVIKDVIGDLMELDNRTESYIVMSLLERGIAAYQRDGLLREPQNNHTPVEVPRQSKKIKAG
jgi:hypothetical protein